MKTVDYKKLVKLPADTMFSTISRMNELGEVLVIGEYPDGHRFIYSPLADAGGAGNREIDFDDNGFNRAGSFVVWEVAELAGFVEKLQGIIEPETAQPTQLKHGSVTISAANPERMPIVPLYRQESAKNFVAADLVPPTDVRLADDVVVTTAPLAIGAHFSLLGISHTQSLLETGILDTTDAIDPAIALANIYVRVEQLGRQDEVYRLLTLNLPTAAAHATREGGYREMAVNFHQAISIDRDTETVEGSKSKIVQDSVAILFTVSGTVNLELGDTRFFAQRIDSLRTDDGLVRFSVIGYDLDAGRVNHNRQRRAA